jgi:hypothetical protein
MKQALALLLLLGCGDDATRGARTAEECVQSDLIDQCPPGSNPLFDAQAKTLCEGAADADLIAQNGSVSGQCRGEGTCKVLCQFQVPCECGVLTISEDELVCADCTDLPGCGNGMCEGTENPDNCAIDCGAVCTPDRQRCNGDDREICSVQGRWERVACGEGRRCEEAEGTTQCI